MYIWAVVLALFQFFTDNGIFAGFLALLTLVFARLCEGAEEYEENQRK